MPHLFFIYVMNFSKFYNGYIENVKRQGLSFNYNFLKKKFERGRLGFYNGGNIFKLSDKHFEKFVEMLSICNEIFPNRWDLGLKLYTNNKNNKILCVENLIIHFPKTTIKNSKDYTHEITNLFIQLDLRFKENSKKLCIQYVKGFRTSYTHKEVLSDYCHSHLPKRTRTLLSNNIDVTNLMNPEDFCLGSGEINYILSDLEYKDYNPNLFINLFLNLISLSRWESLEGTPYRYIREVKARKSGSRDRFYIDTERVKKAVVSLLDYWKDRIDSLNLNINLDNKKVEVVDIGNFLDVPENIIQNYKKNLFVSEENGVYYKIDSGGHYGKIGDLSVIPPYLFRGKDFVFEVTERLEEETKEENIFVPPTVKQEICSLLTSKIKYELFKRSIQAGENITYYK